MGIEVEIEARLPEKMQEMEGRARDASGACNSAGENVDVDVGKSLMRRFDALASSCRKCP